MNLQPFALITAGMLCLSGAPLKAAEDAKSGSGKEASTAKIQDVTVAEAADLLAKRKDVVVLDVRSPGEFAEGHIAGAKQIDFNADGFEGKLAELDKSKTYLMHCARGGRSQKTTELMERLKFQSVYHLKSGFEGWKEAGKPVAK